MYYMSTTSTYVMIYVYIMYMYHMSDMHYPSILGCR